LVTNGNIDPVRPGDGNVSSDLDIAACNYLERYPIVAIERKIPSCGDDGVK
jgi:hypothetical protein